MRKNYIAIMIAIFIGMSVYSLRPAAAGVETREDTGEIGKATPSGADSEIGIGTPSTAVSEKSKDKNLTEVISEREETGRLFLKIPEKIQVVIDPFEIDGRGQIYSDPYMIWNTGETAGILTLSFICRPQGDGTLKVQQETAEIHDGRDKSVYIEIVFRDTDRVVLSQKSQEYRIELEPGEGLPFYFVGEVNENASKQWEDTDLKIEGIYTWIFVEEIALDESTIDSIDNILLEEKKFPQEKTYEQSLGKEEEIFNDGETLDKEEIFEKGIQSLGEV